ncbi:M48 family metallopeptidase [Leptolyngbya sp. FACHB-261]|uniref:M48 family metallopeptidase n=1 Tax=Leptolyngbya sp. FACHB-261 TaxID=2692806 RepID=UPI0016893585|nr:M48 family metallopeptidase [Leptolyngbya sp. FACHB-261]MBD2104401.1 M48 family metallopeptidase [Leptolyngbya sp. FACHB-261]
MPTYPGLSSEAFRHPLDAQAELALRNLPGFNLVARKFVEFIYERPQLIYHSGNSIQVGPRQYATLYRIFRECVRDLDVHPEPILFATQNPIANAYSLGQERPYIVINSGLLDLMNEDEIRSVLAHELGHIKCGHTILIQMAMWVMGAITTIGELTFGIGNVVGTGLIYAFHEWKRKAELSCDRAALLALDDLNVVVSSMMKFSGGCHQFGHECSLEEFIKQSEQFQQLDSDGLNQVYKFLLYNGGQGAILSHPFPVDRVHYLREWSLSSEYYNIKSGNYVRGEDSTIDINSTPPAPSEAAELQRQIQELQDEINRLKRKGNS